MHTAAVAFSGYCRRLKVMSANSPSPSDDKITCRPIPARQSFLALVFLIGGIVITIGVSTAFFANSFLTSSHSYQASESAASAALSGEDDALLKLDRNPTFSASSYSLAVGSTTATISVTQSDPSANFITIS